MAEIDTFISLNRTAREAEALRIESSLLIASAPQQQPKRRYKEAATAVESIATQLAQAPSASRYLTQKEALTASLSELRDLYLLSAAQTPPAELARATQRFQQRHLSFVVSIADDAPTLAVAAKRKQPAHHADDDRYRKATDLLAKGVVSEGYAALGALAKQTQSAAMQAECQVGMARLLLNFQTANKLRAIIPSPSTEGIRLLDEVLAANCYSTVLHEAFMRWRTAQQLYTYGVTNDSPIPNALYNTTRDRAIKVVRSHLQKHRDDRGALHQLRGLALCPNIQRTPDRANSAVRDDRELNPPIAEGATRVRARPSVRPTQTSIPPSKGPAQGDQP